MSELSLHRPDATAAPEADLDRVLPWRDGTTDNSMVASTSSTAAERSGHGHRSRPPRRSAQPQHTPAPRLGDLLPGPETQGVCVDGALLPGPGPSVAASQLDSAVVVDLASTLSTWLGGSGASLRQWLRVALEAPSPPVQPVPTGVSEGHPGHSASGAGDAGDAAASLASEDGTSVTADMLSHREGLDALEPHRLAWEEEAAGEASSPARVNPPSAAVDAPWASGAAYSLGSVGSGCSFDLEELLGPGAATATSAGQAVAPKATVKLAPPPMRRPASAAAAATAASGAGPAVSASAEALKAGPAAAASGGSRRPEALAAALESADDWRRVATLVFSAGESLNASLTAAALVRLASLHRAHPTALLAGPAHGREQALGRGRGCLHPDVSRLVEGLLSRLPGLMPHACHADVANMLWALGVMQPLLMAGPGAGSAVGAGSGTACTSRAMAAPAATKPLRLWLAARSPAQRRRHADAAFASAAPAAAAAAGAAASPSPAAAAAEPQPQPSALATATAAAAALLAAKMRHFWRHAGPHSLALALWGMARLGLRPGPNWVTEFESASWPLLPRFSSRQLSYSLWALGTLRLRPHATWLAAARCAMTAAAARVAAAPPAADSAAAAAAAGPNPPRQELGPEPATADADAPPSVHSLSTMLWACAVLSAQLDPSSEAALTAALASRLRAEGPAAGPGALATALWSLARLRVRPSKELLAAWRATASGPVLAAAPARSLSMMAWALAELRAAPPKAWVDQWAAALLARAREAHAGTGDDTGDDGSGSAAGGAGLGPQALCTSLWAAAQLDVRLSAEWAAAFTGAVAPSLRALAPSDLGVALSSLGRLCGRRQAADGDGDGNADGAPVRAPPAAAFLAAADAAAAAALPAATSSDLAGIAGGLRALGLGCTASPELQRALAQRAAELLQDRALRTDHAAEALACLAAFSPKAAAPLKSAGFALHGADRGCPKSEAREGQDASSAPDGTVPVRLVGALLKRVITAERLDDTHVFAVGTALCAAAELGFVPISRPVRTALATAARRAVGSTPGARAALRVLRGLHGLGMRPPPTWVASVAAGAGSRLRGLSASEVTALLRVVSELTAPRDPAAAAEAQPGRRQPAPLTVLLAAAQPGLAAAPIQHLLDLAAATAAAVPPAALPPGWAADLESASLAKLSLPHVSAPSLVELLAYLACCGHAPGPAWAAAWHEATARRLGQLAPAHLATALQLQRRLGMAPPPAWLRAAAAALAAAAAAAALPPLDVLAAAAELQRLGYVDGPAGPPLSTVVAAAASALHRQLAAAEPAAQLATLAALQSVAADPRAPAAAAVDPAVEGWAVGVLAMAHSVIAQRPLHQLLPALQASSTAAAAAAAADGGAQPAAPLVLLLASMCRWGHSPDHRWLAGVARHVCRQAEAAEGGLTAPPTAPPDASAGSDDDGPAATAAAAGWPAADVARAVCCLAALGYVPSADVAERIQRQLTAPLASCELAAPLAAELCAAWAAVRRRPSPAWWRAAEAGALQPEALAALPPAALVRLSGSMTSLGHVPSPQWLLSLLPLLPRALAELRPAPAAAAAATAAASSCSSASLRLTLGLGSDAAPAPNSTDSPAASGARASGRLGLASDVAQLAWALGVAVQKGTLPPAALSDSGALQALLHVTGAASSGSAAASAAGGCGVLCAMGPAQLVLLVEGLARARHRLPPAWLASFAAQVSQQLHACGPSDLVSVLYCLAYLEARPSAAWLQPVLGRMGALLPSLLACEATSYRADDLAWAVAQLDPNGALARPFAAQIARQRAALAAATAAAAAAAAAAEAREGPGGEDGGSMGGAAGRTRPRQPSPGRGGGDPGLAVAREVPAGVEEAATGVGAAGRAGRSGAGAGGGPRLWRGRGVLGGSLRSGRFRLSGSPPRERVA